MSLFNAIDISSSGLTAQRLRMDTISENIANVNTTRTPAGGPYRRKVVLFESRENENRFAGVFNEALEQQKIGNGVRVVGIIEDSSPFKMQYDPNHPDADAQGYVRMPNVNIVTEMVNMISATRAYEANTTSIRASKDIALKALEIGR
ncbi:MAG: flagellar basal body rod protein FlgC [Eubacteriales bacterium]|nr:MAG: flagellar basal body rod protein FlgC [Firmicutes bacterium HGW-Firmicutes-8]